METFKPDDPNAPVAAKDYVIEAYFEEADGGDFWKGSPTEA
jgi:hypothetical protein